MIVEPKVVVAVNNITTYRCSDKEGAEVKNFFTSF